MKSYKAFDFVWKVFHAFLLIFVVGLIIPKDGNISNLSYSSFEISDWLINYEGGFVRRGIVGEILHYAYGICPFDVVYFIVGTCAISFILFCYVIYRCCKKLSMSVIPLLVIICGSLLPIYCYRRDFIMMLIVLMMFSMYIRYLKTCHLLSFIAFTICACFSLLSHEAVFFFSVPILMTIAWFSEDEKWFSKRKLKRILYHFITPIIVMTLVSYYKGNMQVAQLIWNSWDSLFKDYPIYGHNSVVMGNSVRFLNENLVSAAIFHLNSNFRVNKSAYIFLWHLLSFILLLMSTYFLVERHGDMGGAKKSKDRILVGNILLLQFVFMIPMFTVLSCDYARTIMYCVASSIFLAYTLRKENMKICIPSCVYDVSQKIERLCLKYKYLSSPWTYLIIACMYPMSYVGSGPRFPIDCMIKKTIGLIYHGNFWPLNMVIEQL